MSFTARHYNSIQRIIRTTKADFARQTHRPDLALGAQLALETVQADIGRMLAADNPRFDLTRYNLECDPK